MLSLSVAPWSFRSLFFPVSLDLSPVPLDLSWYPLIPSMSPDLLLSLLFLCISLIFLTSPPLLNVLLVFTHPSSLSTKPLIFLATFLSRAHELLDPLQICDDGLGSESDWIVCW